MPQQVQINDLQ
ncbi:aca6c82e-a396-4f73-bc63-4047600beed9 [Thermothielavioides terrestris]|uniref:Aca6c82e-a396-4f73-bc63-4047600beed9 n=1 Tax=Thermothielavioides terrestris TaxID=2587410 RepID=A0A446BI99_9PEZI|nr:aca6c82e-a396-4f73-bc63-4047600beed9 [Thermothielavioides terrestris]